MSILDLDGEFDDELEKLDAELREYTGAPGKTPYSLAASKIPDFFEQLIEAHRHVMMSGELSRELKELVALAVSMTNGCDYCVRAHAKMQKHMFDRTDAELAHLAALVGHITGLNRFEGAAGSGPSGLFEPVSTEDVPLFDEIEDELGHVPESFRAMGRDERYLELVWERERKLVRSGAYDQRTRDYVAFGVAATNGASASTRYRKEKLVDGGESEEAVFEAFEVVELFCKNNKWTEGLLLHGGVWGDR